MDVSIGKNDFAARRKGRLSQIVWIVVALAYAAPLTAGAYEQLVRVNEQARARLIQHHRLWELDANYHGKAEAWTRFASRLLNDRQLLARVAVKYGGQSEEIELEYRRDLTIARAEVIIIAFALWAGPLAALYGIVWLVRHRRRAPPPKAGPASASDPRYRPPG